MTCHSRIDPAAARPLQDQGAARPLQDQGAARPLRDKKDPPFFGFIVTRYAYRVFESYADADAARQSLAARAQRPHKFRILKELRPDGAVAYFVTNYGYRQAPTLAMARQWLTAPDKPRPKTARASKKRSHARGDQRRIRCIINVSGSPSPQMVDSARDFFTGAIAGAGALTAAERTALGLGPAAVDGGAA